jgi:hypothetical protein
VSFAWRSPPGGRHYNSATEPSGDRRVRDLLLPNLREPRRDHDALQPTVERVGRAQLLHGAPSREEHLLREIVAERRPPAQVVHELADAALPPRDDLGKRTRIAGAGEREDERIGRLLEVGGR